MSRIKKIQIEAILIGNLPVIGMPNKIESEWVFIVFGSGWFESRFRSGRFRLFFSVDEFDDSSFTMLLFEYISRNQDESEF